MKFLKVGFSNSTRMSMSLDAFCSPRAYEPKRPILLTANLALISPAWLLRRSIISMYFLSREWFSNAKSIAILTSLQPLRPHRLPAAPAVPPARGRGRRSRMAASKLEVLILASVHPSRPMKSSFSERRWLFKLL
jgi:hypothetical protein